MRARVDAVWAAIRRAPWMIAIGVIALVGIGALVVDLVTGTDTPASTGPYGEIDAYVREQMDGSRIPGAALAIVEDGEVVHVAGFGDDGHGNPITADTPFWIGSNTKSMTALAVMQLAQSGLVDLDAPVTEYLPEFELADPEVSSQITVRHLLNQTSGLARIDGLRAVLDGEAETIEEAVADMSDLSTNRPVGESFEYSNLNSVVLGLVVERVSGTPWDEYVQANIFEPLAMDETFTDRDAADEAGLTATHRTIFGWPVATDGEHVDGLAPSGYVYSSADDMAKYLGLFLRGGTVDGTEILDADGIEEMLTPATNERTVRLQGHDFTARYGEGWFVGPFGAAGDARWHQGSLPHFTAWMVLLPDSDQGVVVLLNAGNQFEVAGANAAWSRIPRGVVDLLRGESPPTGIGAARFHIIFVTLLAIIVVLEVRSLVRTIRRRDGATPRWRVTFGVVQTAVGALLLLAYPGVAGGLGWRAAFTFVPDLSFAVAVVGVLAVLAGLAHLVVTLVSSTRGVAAGG